MSRMRDIKYFFTINKKSQSVDQINLIIGILMFLAKKIAENLVGEGIVEVGESVRNEPQYASFRTRKENTSNSDDAKMERLRKDRNTRNYLDEQCQALRKLVSTHDRENSLSKSRVRADGVMAVCRMKKQLELMLDIITQKILAIQYAGREGIGVVSTDDTTRKTSYSPDNKIVLSTTLKATLKGLEDKKRQLTDKIKKMDDDGVDSWWEEQEKPDQWENFYGLKRKKLGAQLNTLEKNIKKLDDEIQKQEENNTEIPANEREEIREHVKALFAEPLCVSGLQRFLSPKIASGGGSGETEEDLTKLELTVWLISLTSDRFSKCVKLSRHKLADKYIESHSTVFARYVGSLDSQEQLNGFAQFDSNIYKWLKAIKGTER